MKGDHAPLCDSNYEGISREVETTEVLDFQKSILQHHMRYIHLVGGVALPTLQERIPVFVRIKKLPSWNV